ncbi:Uncharacterized protein dnm_033250 [Desulfonema magnum]|uniref:Uncharacterized protein n=1 Tax=Desulfonema magnum TaxID=45655 RepID=A0A975BLF3_9BACT|nr:Uncharacterized protein dnm_033250 [Desulfonema magnum]
MISLYSHQKIFNPACPFVLRIMFGTKGFRQIFLKPVCSADQTPLTNSEVRSFPIC